MEEHPEVNPGGEPPQDDLNEELDGSPIPDPTEGESGTDDPGAD